MLCLQVKSIIIGLVSTHVILLVCSKYYHFCTVCFPELVSEEEVVAAVRILHPKYVKTPRCTQGSLGYPRGCKKYNNTPPLSPNERPASSLLAEESGNIPMEDITARDHSHWKSTKLLNFWTLFSLVSVKRMQLISPFVCFWGIPPHYGRHT